MTNSENASLASIDRRRLGWIALATLGVSFAAAGSFSSWSFGIDRAGWAAMLVAFGCVAAFYLCLLLCLAELAGAMPTSGAGQAFASRAFGPSIGFVAGAASLIQYVFGTSALGYLIGTYLSALTGIDPRITIVVLYVVVVAIQCLGVKEAMALTTLLSLAALVGVGLFLVVTGSSIGSPHPFTQLAGSTIQPLGVWSALPFAVTFLLGVEGVAFAADEAKDPARNLPKGMFVALAVTVLLGLLVLLLGPASAGLMALRETDSPMIAALQSPSVQASPMIVVAVSAAGLCGIGVAFFSSVYGYSRQVAAMARDGELPALLGRVSRHQVPVAGLVIPSTLGMLVALSGKLDQLIVLMVFAGAISYVLIIASFLVLRIRDPGLARPYRAPGGIVVALLGIVLGGLIFSACIAADTVWSSYGAAALICLLAARLLVRRSRARASLTA
jgi:ethanolamine permease